uniref:Uncharacterized protein n=1 Tax=Globisporangium ultimum (strain ATCC 200006 / CBS 805.95 / DAOM BR144) TaxID=431595 RepID=K3WDW1_GLOUD
MPLSLGSNLRRYALRLPVSSYTWVAYAHAAIAAPHVFLMLRMLVYSAYYRRLVFESNTSSRISSTNASSKLHSRFLYTSKYFGSLNRKVFYWRKWLFGHTGLFGLGGPHFRTIFLCQEAVEIGLQTAQAYRMSCWLPRAWLNRSGLVMDLVSMIGVPVFLALPYFSMYAPERFSFAAHYWYDDQWLINMVNECQVIMITSMWELIMRLVFSTTLLMTFMVVKTLIRSEKTKIHSIIASTPLAQVETLKVTPIGSRGATPVEALTTTTATPLSGPSTKPLDAITEPMNNATSTLRRSFTPTRALIPKMSNYIGPRFFAFQDRLVHWGHRVFLLWGLLVLLIQVHADQLPSPQLCGLQVRPWLQLKPSCSILVVDCYKQNLTGQVDEIKTTMDKMNQPMLAHMVFRHCPHLEMPPNLKVLSRLIGLKVYNSTIARWEQDAALTNTHHQYLTFMFLVKVNMTGIPQGLLTNDYPKRLTDVEFSTTNLTTLPDDLHMKWPKGMVLVLERAKFKKVPEVLKHLQVGYLGFNDNNVSDIPIEIFSHPYARSVWLNGNPITHLPDGSVLSSLLRVRVINSNISVETLPEWLPSTFLTHASLNAGGTPLCAQIAALKAAAGDMTALGPQLAKVYENVICTVLTGDLFTYYPLTLEDKYNAGNTALISL